MWLAEQHTCKKDHKILNISPCPNLTDERAKHATWPGVYEAMSSFCAEEA